MELCSLPAVYDTAFQFRHAPDAVDFIEQCVRTYADIPLRSVVDIACGTGHYTREFARRQYRVYGVDSNQEFCWYTRDRAETELLKMEILCCDMREFSLPQPCELALNLFDSLTYLPDFNAIITHFKRVADALVTGGIYLVEFGVIDYFENHNVKEVWTETRRDLTVTTSYFRDGFIDPGRRTFSEQCSFQVTCREHTAFWNQQLLKRALYFEEFLWLLKRAQCFEPVAYYESYAPDAFLPEDKLPWRVIAVLRKI